MASRWLVRLTACFALLLASVVLRAGEPAPQGPPAPAAATDRAVLDRYCVTCHNTRTKTAGLALDTVDVTRVAPDAETWEKVVRKLRGRMMPPPGMPRPDEATFDALATHLEGALDRAAAERPNPGRTETFRRLTRVEYRNAIRDILALDVDVSSLLPKDDASHGFDNVSNGELSPTLLERYLAAAQKVSRAALGSALPSPASHVVVLPSDLTQEDHLEGLPLGSRGGVVFPFTFPQHAVYEIQVRLARDRNENVEGLTEPQQVEISIDGSVAQTFQVRPNRNQSGAYYADEGVDTHLKVRIGIGAGPRTVAVTFPRRTFALEETERQPSLAHFNMDRHPRVQIAVYSVSITGPFETGVPNETPSRSRLFVCRPARSTVASEDACAKRIVSSIARRAFRRPVTDADLEAPLRFYKDARATGDFDAGIEMALRAVLASTEFLFRIERDPKNVTPKTPYRVSDIELASRLSFLLWSSIPDEELLKVAAAGTLSQPATLERQVKRMLADPKSEALVTNFASQWLYLRNLAAASPDARQFPDFDDNLRQAFRRETELFFESIVKEDRSILDMLRANYTFVNERLAKHYGIRNVYGSRFRRVTLPEGTPRGGILAQGSVLTVTSYANRTSPVLRGKWILENIVGTPPPPPPANVPLLQDTDAQGRVLSMRERMAQHRSRPECASCHRLMDPAGLSMENYDAIGRWRQLTESGSPVDNSGALPDGSEFRGLSGLQAALLRKPELFAGTFTEKLMTYGLGRGLEYSDAPAVRAIVRNAQLQHFSFSSLVLGIVRSDPFQMRMSQ
jgi:mono/diheme cytochrome c family protein